MAPDLEPEVFRYIRGYEYEYSHPFVLKADAVIKNYRSHSQDLDYISSGAGIRYIVDSTDLESDCDHSSTSWQESAAAGDFYAAMDTILCYAFNELKNKTSRSDTVIDQLANMTFRGKSLVVEVAERMLIRSLELLMKWGVPSGDDFSPAAILESLENTKQLKPFLHNVHRKRGYGGYDIGRILDIFLMCAEPTKYYFTIAWFYEDRSIGVDELVRGHSNFESYLPPDHQLTYIHVPSTNGLIIELIMKLLELDVPVNVPVIPKKYELSTVAPSDPFLTYKEHGYYTDPLYTPSSNQHTVVFPCLRLTTYGNHKASRAEYEQFREKLTSRTSGPYHAECTVHLARTLDEAYYPGLSAEDLQIRNCDQIVSGKTGVISEEPTPDSPILIVPQLWLRRSKSVVISAYSFTEGWDEYEKSFKKRGNEEVWTWEQQSDLSSRDPLLQMGYLMANCIEGFGKETNVEYEGVKHTFKPALDIFESRVVSVLSQVQKYVDNKRDIDYDVEKDLYHTIADIRSELAMIKHFLRQQQEVFGEFLEAYDSSKTEGKDNGDLGFYSSVAWKKIQQAESKLTRYQERVRKIDGDAERIGSNVQDLLNLKRTYASVQDSHASVLLSTAAIGFAFVTIVFAPLAFLTALFALDIEGFDKLREKMDGATTTTVGNDGTSSDGQNLTVNVNVASKDTAYNSAKIGGIFVGTEILTILLTVSLVWLSLRYVGISIPDLRKEHKQNRMNKGNTQKIHFRMPFKERKMKKGALQTTGVLKKEVGGTAEKAKGRGKVTDEEKQ
ncbi:hypothetical protein DM02DRAFT_674276 [Periconia macrospinosa]|uniref:Uncharacterized protein n=1 Tax=Periconia macrospinosa TaxID=97972 RepID=A0A2V1DGD2_9PLEO|nr:hypothetical protein DM02DRAFT_674276 [Periconia macrospinosa]